jgi:hypothetical protein
MLNNVVGYWAYIQGTYIWGAYIRVGLYSAGGGLYLEWGAVLVCGGLIFGGGGLYSGGLIVGGLR